MNAQNLCNCHSSTLLMTGSGEIRRLPGFHKGLFPGGGGGGGGRGVGGNVDVYQRVYAHVSAPT